MPKATLTFNLPDESHEFMDAIYGNSYGSTLRYIDNWLRDLEKYQDKDLVSIEEVRNKLREETECLPLWE